MALFRNTSRKVQTRHSPTSHKLRRTQNPNRLQATKTADLVAGHPRKTGIQTFADLVSERSSKIPSHPIRRFGTARFRILRRRFPRNWPMETRPRGSNRERHVCKRTNPNHSRHPSSIPTLPQIHFRLRFRQLRSHIPY